MMRSMTDDRLLVESSPGYDRARTVWNAMVDRRPRAIARCASADDVADAVRYGRELSCDNVASYELITADGARLHVDEAGNPELFWGLRGGGGNFGIVTEFEFRLQPVERRAQVVELFFGIDEAAPVSVAGAS